VNSSIQNSKFKIQNYVTVSRCEALILKDNVKCNPPRRTRMENGKWRELGTY